ncbi:hypothetical protein [Microcoleus sp. D3_18_C4]|uniref:hypothetical protein n=1 Tax=Microcoleus sp. D3_18_C4 TaxID=3055335 RepID=UPI002FCE77CF
MANKARNTSGKFAPKSEVPRKVRSVNLTDTAWQWLADVAAQAGVSRNDYLEALADGVFPLMETVSSEISPLMETVETEKKVDSTNTAQQPESDVSPLMETVSHALTTPEEALAHAAIFGFTPEEALADSHFQIAMLQSNYDELEDRYEAKKRELESLRQELEELKADYADRMAAKDSVNESLREQVREISADRAKLLESSITIKSNLERQVQELRSQLATERADREEIEVQLADLKQNSAPATSLDKAHLLVILNQFLTKYKKSNLTYAQMKELLGMIEKSCDDTSHED